MCIENIGNVTNKFTIDVSGEAKQFEGLGVRWIITFNYTLLFSYYFLFFTIKFLKI